MDSTKTLKLRIDNRASGYQQWMIDPDSIMSYGYQ